MDCFVDCHNHPTNLVQKVKMTHPLKAKCDTFRAHFKRCKLKQTINRPEQNWTAMPILASGEKMRESLKTLKDVLKSLAVSWQTAQEKCTTVAGEVGSEDPKDGSLHHLVVCQAISMPRLQHNLLRPMQLRLNDILVDERPKFLSPDPTEKTHAIQIPIEKLKMT
jgi:hypothetical protein